MNADRAVFVTAMLVGLTSCAPYWQPAPWGKQPPPRVVEKPGPFMCGDKPAIGCYRPGPNLIEIQSDLPPHVKDCVLSHEIVWRTKHSLGFQHDDRSVYAIDCGTGEIVAPR